MIWRLKEVAQGTLVGFAFMAGIVLFVKVLGFVFPDPPPTQMDRIEAKLDALLPRPYPQEDKP